MSIDETNYTVPISINDLLNQKIYLQADGGANRSMTSTKDFITESQRIILYRMGGIGSGITCIGKVSLALLCSDGSIVLIRMFYSPEATCTIISPTDIIDYHNKFDSWR